MPLNAPTIGVSVLIIVSRIGSSSINDRNTLFVSIGAVSLVPYRMTVSVLVSDRGQSSEYDLCHDLILKCLRV